MCYSRCVILIRKLIWDSWNVNHIARHHVVPDEVETLCHGLPVVLRGQQKSRLVLIGQTEEKRILGVVLEARGNGKYYPITAYDADSHDTLLFRKLRGGENDETNE